MRGNAVMERWVQTCRRELLDRTLIWNQAHLLHALREFERFYNSHRPHQGIANARPLRALPTPIPVAAITRLHVHRHDRLGGILHEYHHAALPARMRLSASTGLTTEQAAGGDSPGHAKRPPRLLPARKLQGSRGGSLGVIHAEGSASGDDNHGASEGNTG
jgi:Integrase core domain